MNKHKTLAHNESNQQPQDHHIGREAAAANRERGSAWGGSNTIYWPNSSTILLLFKLTKIRTKNKNKEYNQKRNQLSPPRQDDSQVELHHKTGPLGYKTFFMLNSTEHEISTNKNLTAKKISYLLLLNSQMLYLS